MYFLFNRTTLQVFVTYLTGALYVHPLRFYKHQHDNRVRSKLSVTCQRWWFQCRFWFVPSVPGYLREEEEHKPDPWRNPIESNHMRLHLGNEVYCVWQFVNTPTIIFNNAVFIIYVITMTGDRGGTVVKVLWYKLEGRWFDPRCCQWIFLWHNILPIALWSWGRLSL